MDDNNKVKLMCSYGGKIHPRPSDLQLSYFGGHTKILTVNRNINFSNLLSKLQHLSDCNLHIQIKYKLPSGGHQNQHLEPLISVFDDDDVNHMMFEYHLLRNVSTKPARFRLFLFSPVMTAPVQPMAMATPAPSLNPDFLFGFDKEYSFNYTEAVTVPVGPSAISGNLDVVPENVIIGGGYGAPNYDPGVFMRDSYVYREPVNAGGCFQAGLYNRYTDCGGK